MRLESSPAVVARPHLLERGLTAVERTARAAAEGPSVRAYQLYPSLYAVVFAYAVVSSLFMAHYSAGLSVTHFLLIAMCAAAATLQARPLVWQVIPVAMAPLLFADLGTVSAHAGSSTHVTGPIDSDRFLLGGHVATLWFQSHVLTSPLRVPLTVIFIPTYLSLWVVPLPFVLWIWLRHPERFASFGTAFLLLEALGFLTFLIYPETPPWLAAQQGHLPPVDRVVVGWLGPVGGFGPWYARTDPAPLEAMPAMHVAVPMLEALVLMAVWRRRASWLVLLYPATVGVGVLYLGEHYVVDVIVAVALAVVSFAVGEAVQSWPPPRLRSLRADRTRPRTPT